jgi:hypothetical protein
MLWRLIHIATIGPLLPQFSSIAKAQISSSETEIVNQILEDAACVIHYDKNWDKYLP